MSSLKKKLIAGILSGAILFGGGLALNLAQAAEPSANQDSKIERRHRERPQMTNEQINQYAKDLAEYYGLNQAEIAAALRDHVHFEDVRQAATLAKLSGKSFSEVLAMKTDWHQVAEKLGVNHEQMESFMQEEMLEGLAKKSRLNKKTVESLLKDNYTPHDITIAGIIASESGKDVKNVLSKRKINNTWEDVAKEFKVDISKLRRHGRGPDSERD